MPPQVNARITAVLEATAAAGNRDDWDDPDAEPAGAGAQKWAGTVEAFLEETASRSFASGSDDLFERRRLHIDSADYRTMAVDTDDVIVYTGPDGVERSAEAKTITVAELAGIPRALQTTTIELRAA